MSKDRAHNFSPIIMKISLTSETSRCNYKALGELRENKRNICPFSPWAVGQKVIFYHFPKRQILDSSNLKEFADDNLEFDENGRKFSKRVENSEGKREIACHEQFLLFPQCFQKTCTAGALKPGLVWERVVY